MTIGRRQKTKAINKNAKRNGTTPNRKFEWVALTFLVTALCLMTVSNLGSTSFRPATMDKINRARPSPRKETPVIPLIVQLSGEMANNLAFISNGLGYQVILEQRYNISTKLYLRHQNHDKWKLAHRDISNCFPILSRWNFSHANTLDFDEAVSEQERRMEDGNISKPTREDLRGSNDQGLRAWLDHFAVVSRIPRNSKYDIPIPFFYLQRSWYQMVHHLDASLPSILETLRFDSRCCRRTPGEDEHVFHLRNFAAEMPRAYKRGGYEEFSPAKLAGEVFSHLRPAEKVVIVTRYDYGAREHEAALRERGLDAATVSGQSGVEDFCFLMRAKREVVGSAMSSFAFMASLLGLALGEEERVFRRYFLDSLHRRRLVRMNWDLPVFRPRNYTRRVLRRWLMDEMYESEELERWIASEGNAFQRASFDFLGNPFAKPNLDIVGGNITQ